MTIKSDTGLAQSLVHPDEKLQQPSCSLPVVMALAHQQIQKHHWKAHLFGAKQLLAGYSNAHNRTRNSSTRNTPSLNYSKFRLTRENNQTSWDKNMMKCTRLSNEHMKLRVQGFFYIQTCPSRYQCLYIRSLQTKPEEDNTSSNWMISWDSGNTT